MCAFTFSGIPGHGRVIPPVPLRQWGISVPKRLRCFLADRPEAVAAVTKIFLAEIERLLSAAAVEIGARSSQTRQKRHRRGCGAFRETRFGCPGRSSRDSGVAHKPEDRCRSPIDRAILGPLIRSVAEVEQDGVGDGVDGRHSDVRSTTPSVGGTLRWVAPAGVSGDRLAFKVRAFDGAIYSTVTAQVTINLATAV